MVMSMTDVIHGVFRYYNEYLWKNEPPDFPPLTYNGKVKKWTWP